MKFIFTFLVLLLLYIILSLYYKDGFTSTGLLIIFSSSLISYYIDQINKK